jgi:hypothetical protein
MLFKNPISLFSKPAVPLKKLTSPNAADLASKIKPEGAAKDLLKPGQSSSEYIHALQQNQQSMDAVKGLAHGMPEQDSVKWACESSRKVADKLNPEETAALEAAEAWVKSPTPEAQAAAQAAATKTDFSGPGGWAAQAASWAKSPSAGAGSAPSAGAGAPAAAGPGLAASAVVGSVLLAAGLTKQPAMPPPQKPKLDAATVQKIAEAPISKTSAPQAAPAPMPAADQGKLAKLLDPFIDLGKNIASGAA